MKYLFLLLICVCCCLFGYARPVIVYDDDNLSCNRIISLEQDAYGFIWIATEDGLNKFDGYTFCFCINYHLSLSMVYNKPNLRGKDTTFPSIKYAEDAKMNKLKG